MLHQKACAVKSWFGRRQLRPMICPAVAEPAKLDGDCKWRGRRKLGWVDAMHANQLEVQASGAFRISGRYLLGKILTIGLRFSPAHMHITQRPLPIVWGASVCRTMRKHVA